MAATKSPAWNETTASATAGLLMEKQRTYPLMSRREIEVLIASGRSVFILDQYVLKVDGWMKYHPGGDKSILHMVGRDATDEVTALHSSEAKTRMERYRIGRIEGRWKNFVPPIQGGEFRASIQGDDDEFIDSIGTPSTSDSSSRSASPIFDAREPNLRHRHNGTNAGFAVPVASARGNDEDVETDGMSYLDSETRKKIILDLEKYPSLDAATQDAIVRKYRLLNETLKAQGLYECNYHAYAVEVTRYCLLFAGMLAFLRLGWYVPSAICLGCFWHQLVFTAHDAGHMGITHNFHIDTVIGIFIADFMGGLSIGWWKRNHNVHHIVTNSPEHDPDIEHMPFMAVSHRLLSNLRSSYYERLMAYDTFAKVFLSIQAYTYYPVMALGRFNLYFLSWDHLIAGRGPRHGPAWWHRWLEVVGQVFFWAWFGYGILYQSIPTGRDRLVFILISHMMQMSLHTQITLSHFAMSTAELGPDESFPQKMLRTTMDVDCPQWLDFFHGGLQFQAIHHLYPRMPRHNLRAAQKLVLQFCNEVGIPYALYGFVDGNKEVIGRLAEVSQQAAILAKCQRAVAKAEGQFHGVNH